jgi:hypothetical protein
MANNKEALRKWDKLDRSTQNMLLENVFCLNCKVTTYSRLLNYHR